ncbi:MAG: tail fiber domain-containing protein [Candidatus Korobacteraceae bacterium]
MRHIRFAPIVTILALCCLTTAQQKNSASTESATSPIPPPGPIIGGMGTANYIPVWADSVFIVNSTLYQNSSGMVGVGTTNPAAKLDVSGSMNVSQTYQIDGQSILNPGSSGDQNLFVGLGAGADNVDGQGQYNVFAGYGAGMSNTSGNQNVMVGSSAGLNNTTGIENIFVGNQTGYANTSGGGNVFLGNGAGHNNTNGNANVVIGTAAGGHLASGMFNIYIGAFSGSGSDESNTIRIGSGQQSAAYIPAIYNGISAGGLPVYVNDFGLLGTQTSSLRFKEQVRDMGDSTENLMKLRPVTFYYKPDYAKGDHTLQFGLIAEEVAAVYPELVANDTDGKPYAVRYQYLTSMLLNEVQRQYHRAQAEAAVISAQQQKIDDLEQRLSRLERMVPQTVAENH